MKRKCIIIAAIIIAVIICGAIYIHTELGNVSNVSVDINPTSKFSSEELNAAVKCIKHDFHYDAGFVGCKLEKITYDEERSDPEVDYYIERCERTGKVIARENVVVLDVDFHTGDREYVTFISDFTYDWHWTLVRDDAEGEWKVASFGF